MGFLVSVSADVDEHLVPAATQKQIHYSSFLLNSPLICKHHKLSKCMIFSPSIETPPFACTTLPVAAIPRILFRFDMEVIDMIH